MASEVPIDKAVALDVLRTATQRGDGSRKGAIALMVLCLAMTPISPVMLVWVIPPGIWCVRGNTRFQTARAARDRLANEDATCVVVERRLLIRDRRGQSEYWLSAGERRAFVTLPPARAVPRL